MRTSGAEGHEERRQPAVTGSPQRLAIVVLSAVGAGAAAWFGFRLLRHRDPALVIAALVLLLIIAVLGVLLIRARRTAARDRAWWHELREREARWRRVLDQAQDVIFTCDDAGRITFVNEAAQQVYGKAAPVLMGTPLIDLSTPERREADTETIRRALGGEPQLRRATRHRGHEGQPVDVLVSLAPVRDPQGRTIGVTGTAANVSELVRMQEALLHRERTQSLGALSAGLAHHFNNLLTTILGHAELAEHRLGDVEGVAAHLHTIRGAGDQARRLTQQLLAFARRQHTERQEVDLRTVLEGVDTLCSRLLGDTVTLHTSTPEEPLIVHANLGQIEQVLLTMVVTARDALGGGGGDVHVVLAPRTDPAGAYSAPMAWAQIEVHAQGPALDLQAFERAWDPLFREPEEEQGPTLGLPMVAGVVEQHGGTMSLELPSGEGSALRILLPRVVAGMPREPVPAAPPAAGGSVPRSCRVLLVEDDEAVREVAAAMLAESGHTVTVAGGPEEALHRHLDALHAFDILITDMRMPGMRGTDMAERMRTVRPDLPVLFISGYIGADIESAWHEVPGVALLKKPFTHAQLIARMEALVATAPRTSSEEGGAGA